MAEDGGGGNGAEGSPKPSRAYSEETPHCDVITRVEEVAPSPPREEEDSPRESQEPCRPHVRRKSHELCVITCKGTLGDPAFNKSFRRILSGLNKLLNTGEERVRVRKVEPWNSVRVTFTIPGDAAQRLRALALGGDSALSRLGILSVQLDPEQVIRVGAGAIQQLQPPINPDSLPLPPSSTLPGLGGTSMSSLPGSSLSGLMASTMMNSPLPGPSSILGGPSLPGPSTGPLTLPGPSGIMAGPSTSGLTSPLLASSSLPGPSSAPVLAGPSSSLLTGSSAGPSAAPILPPPHAGPPSIPSSVSVAQPRPPTPKVFPFHSMNQAATVMRATEQPPQPNTRPVVSGYPPPPYPNKVEGQVVSPLLVNLLQDSPSSSASAGISSQAASLPPPPPPPPNHQVRVKQQEDSSAFVPVGAGANSYGGGAFRRLPPPYPGRTKEEVQPTPRETVLPPPPPVQLEEKKPLSEDTSQHQESSSTSQRQYLINPLTGVLEPMSSEDEEEEKMEPILDDDLSLDKESCDIATPVSCNSSSSMTPAQNNTTSSLSHAISASIDHPPQSAAVSVESMTPLQQPQPKEEKIKLRLKLDKEAVVSVGTVVSSENPSSTPSPLQDTHTSPGYKVEMYVKRSHESSHMSSSSVVSSQVQSSMSQMNSSLTNNGVEVPRVPPLHISLRGRNAAVVKKDKKRDTKKARKVSGELKRMKSKLVLGQPMIPVSPERSPTRPEPVRSPSPVSPRNDPEMSGDIVPVRNYPSEAEVASILRSVVPHTTHKLLDDSKLKRRESKKKMYPRLEYTGSKKGTKKGSGFLLKSVVKTNSKEVRMMSAVNKAIHRRDSADSTVTNSAVFGNAALKQRSNSVPGNGSNNSAEEFRPKVNCVFGKTAVTPVVTEASETTKVVVNMCVNTGGSPTSVETPTTAVPGQKNQPDPAKRNNEGDDSGIESMDALSEKSPNQGESPQRTTGGGVSCKSVGVTCGESPKPDQTQNNQMSTKDDQLSASDIVSVGGGESPVPVRLTPALYTYSNPEKLERRGGGGESLSPSSVSGDEEDHLPHSKSHPSPEVDEEYSGSSSGRRSSSNKSLLEQLLIDMPNENSTASTNPSSSLNSSDAPSTEVQTSGAAVGTNGSRDTRRSRPSRHKTWDSQTWQTNHIDSRPSSLRVSKRKCSESASDGKPEDLGSPLSHDKTKPVQTRNSSTPGDEMSEEDGSSVASGDITSNRSSISPAPPLQSPRLRHTKADHPESPQQDKNANGTGNVSSSVRREVSVVLTKISRRSVRQQKTVVGAGPVSGSQKDPSSPPVPSNISKEMTPTVVSPSPTARRKTRSQASDSNSESGSAAKRRRMSKDMK